MNPTTWSNEAKAGVITLLLYILLALIARWREVRRLNALYPDGWEEVLVDEWMWEVMPVKREPIDRHEVGQAIAMMLIPFVAFASFALVGGLIFWILETF